MRVSNKKKQGDLGRCTHFSPIKFNIDSIYFSDERIDSDIMYAQSVSISKYTKGLRIRTGDVDECYNIDIEYGELKEIKITDPDECTMPYEQDTSKLSNALMGWTTGIRSLHDIKLRIGGRIEFHYTDEGAEYEVTLYHSKQELFDMFKYVRKHFGKYVSDKQE